MQEIYSVFFTSYADVEATKKFMKAANKEIRICLWGM